MTNSQVDGSTLVVVDGSNIATEGRSVPSLAQLNDAVLALTSEFPEITVTVVVDATFGHRIDKSEVAEFDEAVAHNELVTPPAGAIGRGDAFVLSIANKVGARIFSNDSFQEFHGAYSWLFDEGRLIGGKPVPHVGWVFVNRVPVKGPVSRKARGSGKEGGVSRRTVSKLASLPMPIPTAPPPGRLALRVETPQHAAAESPSASGRGRRRKSDDVAAAEPVPATGRDSAHATPAASPVSGGPVNDLLPFLDFVEQHPVGTAVTAVVETYSSHGAYVKIGDVRGYVPLRLMGSPPPRSAREVMRLGDMVSLVVTSFAPPRRSIDLAVPGAADIPPPPADEPAPKRRTRKAAASPAPETATVAPEAPSQTPTEPKRRRGRKAESEDAAVDAPVTEQARSRRRRKPAAETGSAETPSTPPAAKKAAATKSTAAKKATPAAKSGAVKKSAAAKTTAARKSPAAKPATTPKEPTQPAKKSRASASTSAAPSGAEGTSTRRTTKKAAAGKSEAGATKPTTATEPRRRRSKPTGD